jgi:hypothetical protein
VVGVGVEIGHHHEKVNLIMFLASK